MAAGGVATLEITASQDDMEEQSDAIDERSPLSPSAPKKFSISSSTSSTSTQCVDDIDPFSFKPPFTLCDKILVLLEDNDM